MDQEPAHRVTLGSMYQKLEGIDDKVNILVERDQRDYETLQKHTRQIEWLQKAVYFAALPLTLIASAVLGIEKISRLFLWT